MTCNPFDKVNRTTALFDQLASTLSAKSPELLNALCQLFRFALLEKREGWYELINKYDLLVPIIVSSDYGNLTRLTPSLSIAPNIRSAAATRAFYSEDRFLATPIAVLSGESFTAREFIQAIAYNGPPFHINPASNNRPLVRLWEGLHTAHSAEAYAMAEGIAGVLVDSFGELHTKLAGDNNAYSDVYSRQAQIIENGSLVTDGRSRAAPRYRNSYTQLPVRARDAHGIRILMDLQLLPDAGEGTIFSHGHRDDHAVVISVLHAGTKLLVRVNERRHKGHSKTIPLAIDPQMRINPFMLEVALYPNGQLVVSINESMCAREKLPLRYNLRDGKLMVGADLDGLNSGQFLCPAFVLQAIDTRNRITPIFSSGTYALAPSFVDRLSPLAERRPGIRPQ